MRFFELEFILSLFGIGILLLLFFGFLLGGGLFDLFGKWNEE